MELASVLVTGGAGFIGSHMAERLLNLGYAVTIIDNESTGFRENVPVKAKYIFGDVRNKDDLEKAFDSNIKAVFHIAGQASNVQFVCGSYKRFNYECGRDIKISCRPVLLIKCREFYSPVQ